MTKLKIPNGWPHYGTIYPVLAAIFGASFLCTAQLSAADELWQLALREQLASAHKCSLAVVIDKRKFDLAGDPVIEGRIRCFDGREYDFSRAKPHLKFDIRLCQPAVC